MKKLINYVLNGEGLGAKYLLVLALVVSIIVSIMLRIGGSEAIPYAQSIADQMLPVKVQNGRVITPADTLKNRLVANRRRIRPHCSAGSH